METALRPESEAQLRAVLAWALAESTPLEVAGRGTKRGLGRPGQYAHRVDTAALAGIMLYEPEELVLEAKAGTPLAAIEDAVAAKSQMLAFEPADWGRLYGAAAGAATIGGVIACNLSGPRRPTAGAARDHLLGFAAISGRAEAFKAGGRVVKNVTGYDLCKLLTGSHGTLAVLTSVTLKVLPTPETGATLVLDGLDDAAAIALLAEIAGAAIDGSGFAYLPAARGGAWRPPGLAPGVGAALIRLEGTRASVAERAKRLTATIGARAPLRTLDRDNSLALWRGIRDVEPFVAAAPDAALWRLSLPPDRGAAVVAAIAVQRPIEYFYDWAGGLVWLQTSAATDGGAAAIRAALADVGGHATLVRAPDALRGAVAVFEPQAPALARLTRRVKDSFDPRAVLNPGRMYAGV
ncbi:MAG: glycolate oxidase subunit GlcE [Alphaproteobacteria bacterium]|nr:glycolate oxidase subunit GlcE [Alphaproteobacteria bacterium]